MVHIYGDGDLQVEIAGTKWTINPNNVTKLEGDGVPLTPGTSGKPLDKYWSHRVFFWCVCVCVCACVRACVRAFMCAC